MSIKDHLKGNVTFMQYRDGDLYYKTELGLVFTVPISDIGDATFLAQDKAVLFMRYIRIYLQNNPWVNGAVNYDGPPAPIG